MSVMMSWKKQREKNSQKFSSFDVWKWERERMKIEEKKWGKERGERKEKMKEWGEKLVRVAKEGEKGKTEKKEWEGKRLAFLLPNKLQCSHNVPCICPGVSEATGLVVLQNRCIPIPHLRLLLTLPSLWNVSPSSICFLGFRRQTQNTIKSLLNYHCDHPCPKVLNNTTSG